MAFKRSGVRIPLAPPKNIVHFVRYFLFEDRGFHDFIVMLLCNTNPCGLTLHFASKLARFAITEASKAHFLRIPLAPPKNIVHFVRYFLFEDRGFHDFIVMLLCNTNPCGLPASKERRKRNAFAEIVRSGHSKQTRHAVSRVPCAVVRQHRLFSVDASLCK